jgi:hypothetical protein
MVIEPRKSSMHLPTFDSIKKYLIGFGLAVLTFFLVQTYLIMDPHHITGKSLGTYEHLLEQDVILREITQFIDQQHTAQKALIQENDLEALQTISTLQQTIGSHIHQLQEIVLEPEWVGAYKTLKDLFDAYQKSQEKFLGAMKAFVPLKDLLLTKSTKPIFDLLSEIKFLGQTPQEQQALHSIASKLTLLDDRLKKTLEKKSNIDKALESLAPPMEAVTTALASFLRLVDKKQDIRTDAERLQTLILNYFSSIHQIKTFYGENPNYLKELEGQTSLLIKFVQDLQIGLQANQKETFEAFYHEAKETKKKSVFLLFFMTLLVLGFFLFFYRKVHHPISKLPSFLLNQTALPSSSLKEVQALLEAVKTLQVSLTEETQRFFQNQVQDNSEKLDRKVDLLAGSALELSKVSASIAKIPKIFDQKFTAIHKANDEARLHFRHMVQSCEEMKNLLEKLVQQAEMDPSLLTPPAFDSLRVTAADILAKAHEAAVESQSLGLRFNSLIRTKDETLEVSKLFSKAGTRVNQLARSLKEDLKSFFDKIKL